MIEALFSLHLFLVAFVPVDMGKDIYASAKKEQIDPYDLATFLLTEHSSDTDYSIESLFVERSPEEYQCNAKGKHGEIGLFQVMPSWAIREGYSSSDLFDCSINTLVAASVVSYSLDSHTDETDEGSELPHPWWAHLKSPPGKRGKIPGTVRQWECVRSSLLRFFSPHGC